MLTSVWYIWNNTLDMVISMAMCYWPQPNSVLASWGCPVHLQGAVVASGQQELGMLRNQAAVPKCWPPRQLLQEQYLLIIPGLFLQPTTSQQMPGICIKARLLSPVICLNKIIFVILSQSLHVSLFTRLPVHIFKWPLCCGWGLPEQSTHFPQFSLLRASLA